MARTAGTIPAGMRLTDHISLGVLTTQFPRELVDQVLFETERVNERERALPAHVMVYYVLALALYADVSTQEVLRCVVEGARWLGEPSTTDLPTKSAISQARIRPGGRAAGSVVSRGRCAHRDGGDAWRVVSRVAGDESRRDHA